jgi:peptide-methionine (R)-S-oxide reductase
MVLSIWPNALRFLATAALLGLISCNSPLVAFPDQTSQQKSYPVKKTEKQWKKELTSSQFHVLREKGTERAFSGKYWNEKRAGTYVCAACGQALFESDTKFKSGTGWPSFTTPVDKKAVQVEVDTTFGMRREEILCSRCGGHLGHIFPDGPQPTGLRYCINSESLDLELQSEKPLPSPMAAPTSTKSPASASPAAAAKSKIPQDAPGNTGSPQKK